MHSYLEGRQPATPKTTLIDLNRKPSTQFGSYPFQLGVTFGDPYPKSILLFSGEVLK